MIIAELSTRRIRERGQRRVYKSKKQMLRFPSLRSGQVLGMTDLQGLCSRENIIAEK